MKILLLSGAINKLEKHGDYGKAAPQMHPYGLLCLAAVLEKNGYTDIKIVDTELRNLSIPEVIAEIEKYRPTVIGVATYTLAMQHLIQLLTTIRAKFPEIVLVAGGPHVTLFPKLLVEKGIVDYCCVGEGEYAFLELIQHLDKGIKVKHIANVVYKDKGEVVQCPNRAFTSDLDELPFPSFHLLKDDLKYYYPQPMTYLKRPVVTLITSRGCPYGCKFCSAKSIWTRKWRYNSAKYVVDLIEYLIREFGIKEVCFFEDTFAVNKERVIDFCKLMIEKNIDIVWSASVNIRNIDEEVAQYMKKAKCWLVSCGIETGSDKIMSLVGKPQTIKEVEEKVKMLDRVGIKVRGYFMLGHVGDTKETIQETIKFSKSLPLYSANFSIFVPVPGSDFHQYIFENSSSPDTTALSTYGSGNEELIFVPEGLTTAYLKRMQRQAFFEFFFRFRQILLYVESIRSFEDIRRYYIMSMAAVTLCVRTISGMAQATLQKMLGNKPLSIDP